MTTSINASAAAMGATPRSVPPLTLQGTDPQQFEAFVKQMEDVTVAVSKFKKENN